MSASNSSSEHSRLIIDDAFMGDDMSAYDDSLFELGFLSIQSPTLPVRSPPSALQDSDPSTTPYSTPIISPFTSQTSATTISSQAGITTNSYPFARELRKTQHNLTTALSSFRPTADTTIPQIHAQVSQSEPLVLDDKQESFTDLLHSVAHASQPPPPISQQLIVDPDNKKNIPTSPNKKARRPSRIHTCVECTFAISNLRKLSDHMRDEHSVQGFECNHCGVRVSRFDNLKSHEKTCKKLQLPPPPLPTPNKRPAVPSRASSGSVRPEKRQRVNVLDLQNMVPSLAPAPAQSVLPSRAVSPGQGALTPMSPDNQPVQQEDSNTSQLSSHSNEIVPVIKPYPLRNLYQLSVENEALKAKLQGVSGDPEEAKSKLEEMTEESDLWKRQYLQLKQRIVTAT
ncbi:hypothetical protein ABW20_dc0104995 [Dactylellina cionopaga]|nr:hypothetical protein ABW20_dc0104995 [Dactylellina cionopaga]